MANGRRVGRRLQMAVAVKVKGYVGPRSGWFIIVQDKMQESMECKSSR
jgi:hypothetical protein